MIDEQRIIDITGILTTTRDAPRDSALRLREALLQLIRAVEDMHDFPHSHQTKVERGEREAKTGHHNR